MLISFLDIDECASRPCQNNGVCVNEVNFYVCACVAGWTGVNCETSKKSFNSVLMLRSYFDVW